MGEGSQSRRIWRGEGKSYINSATPNKDVATFEEYGVIWVLATLADTQSPGGISTFSNIGRGNNWWKIEENIDIPPELKLIIDHDNHWLWQPGQIMIIDTYRDALKIVGAEFSKIN